MKKEEKIKIISKIIEMQEVLKDLKIIIGVVEEDYLNKMKNEDLETIYSITEMAYNYALIREV